MIAFLYPILNKKKELSKKIIARIMFDNGPATATIASPHFLFFKLLGLKGTGLAQPRIKEDPDNAKKNGINIEPNRSI